MFILINFEKEYRKGYVIGSLHFKPLYFYLFIKFLQQRTEISIGLPGKDKYVFSDTRQGTHVITTMTWHLVNNENRVLLITNVSMKFHEILFNRSEVVVWTKETEYLTFELY